MDEQTFKDALLKKRTEILGTGGIKPLQASMDNNTRQGDMADQASGNNEVHIALKLKQTDAKILQAIEEALWRIDKGHLRHVPRLRRADRAGAAQRDSLDARLHHLQGKTELVTRPPAAAAGVLPREAGDAAAPPGGRAAHRAVRRQQHLPIHHQPRRNAADLGRHGDRGAGRNRRRRQRAEPAGQGQGRDAAHAIMEEDARDAQAFVDRWRPRIDAMTNARHAKMLRVILGEVLEQKRFFEQALAGRTDLLGRRGAAPRARATARCCPRGGSSSRIALGSNLGDRRAHLDHAVARLRTLLRHLAVSRYYDTAPVGVVRAAARCF